MRLRQLLTAGRDALAQRLSSHAPQPDLEASRQEAARAIDAALARAQSAPRPAFAEGLLRGLDVPLATSLLGDRDPYVFVSHVRPYDPTEHAPPRPECFRVVDDTQFRPSLTQREAAREAEGIAKKLSDFALRLRRDPEVLLEKKAAFSYKVAHAGSPEPEVRTAPEMDVLEYALRERNAVAAGLIAFELANLARARSSAAAHAMLRRGVAVAVEIEDGPYASMLLMALTAARPRSWLHTRIDLAMALGHPVALTLASFRQLAGRDLGLESDAWRAHWLHHDPSVRDFVDTCTLDVLLYAAGRRLQQACGTEPIHTNHFMHGTMVLTELKDRLRVAARRASSPAAPAAAAALRWAERLVEIADLDPRHCDLHGKLSLLTKRLDGTCDGEA